MTVLMEQHGSWEAARSRLGVAPAKPKLPLIIEPIRVRAERLQRKGLLMHEIAAELRISKAEVESILYWQAFALSPALPPAILTPTRRGIYSPIWRSILDAVCVAHRVSPDDVLGRSRTKPVATCRHHAIREVFARTRMSLLQIAKCFNRDHTTIMHSLGRRRRKPRLPA